jgi:hypothetical protein
MKGIITVFSVIVSIFMTAAFAGPYSSQDSMGRPSVNITSGTLAVKDEPAPKKEITMSSREAYTGSSSTTSKGSCWGKNEQWCNYTTKTCKTYTTFIKYYVNGTFLLEKPSSSRQTCSSRTSQGSNR